MDGVMWFSRLLFCLCSWIESGGPRRDGIWRLPKSRHRARGAKGIMYAMGKAARLDGEEKGGVRGRSGVKRCSECAVEHRWKASPWTVAALGQFFSLQIIEGWERLTQVVGRWWNIEDAWHDPEICSHGSHVNVNVNEKGHILALFIYTVIGRMSFLFFLALRKSLKY